MGANPTQAGGIVCTLIAFTLLAVAMAGGGVMAFLGFLVVLGAAVFLFLKCKPWEDQSPDSGGSTIRVSTQEAKL
jgi:hypothetical protein